MQIGALTINVKAALSKLFSTGFFDIVGAGFINKALSFLLSIVLVRIMSKSDYGVYAYAFNIASFFIMFNGLGSTSAILQVCSELHDDRNESNMAYAFGYRFGVISDLGMGVVMALVALFVPLAIAGSNVILLFYCAYPLLCLLCDLKLTYLRVQLANRKYALMTNLQTVLNVVLSIVGALLFQVMGLVVGQCLACLVSWIVMCSVIPQADVVLKKTGPYARKHDFIRLSLVSALNNALGQALTLVGTFLVGLFLADAETVALYKVATTIPFALLFLPSMVVTYAYPYFARNKDNRTWTIRNYARLVGASAASMGFVALLLAVFAEPLIVMVFGSQYLESTAVCQLLLVGFFITAAFRQPTGSLLVTQRKLLYNTLVGVVSIIFNIILSVLIIPEFGMLGAAAVYDATMLLGAIMNVSYYRYAIRRIAS